MPSNLPDIEYSYGVSLSDTYEVHNIKFEGNYGQRARVGVNSVRQKWTLTFRNVTTTEMVTLRDFFRGLAGVDTISWTPPEESSALLFIAPKSPKFTKNQFNSWTCSVGLEQVFDED